MFLQFVGLPGSGKSSVARALARNHAGRFGVVAPPSRRLHHMLAAHPLLTLRLLARLAPHTAYALARRHCPAGLAGRYGPTASLMNLLVTYTERRREAGAGRTQVFEEFVLQRALGLLAFSTRAPARGRVEAYLGSFGDFPARPVFLDLPPELALERARRRAGGPAERFRNLPETTATRVFAVQYDLIQELAERSADAIRVDAAGGAGSAADTIARRCP